MKMTSDKLCFSTSFAAQQIYEKSMKGRYNGRCYMEKYFITLNRCKNEENLFAR